MHNLFKASIILFIVIAFNVNTFGQHQLGVKASGGLSKITWPEKLSSISLNTPFVPSGQGGVYYNLSMGKKALLGAELLFSQIEGKEEREMDIDGLYGLYAGHSSTLTLMHMSYLSMPVYVGFKFNKLTIHGGFQVSYALTSSGRIKNTDIVMKLPEETYIYERNKEDLNLTTGDFGPRAGLYYQLTDQLAVEGSYYYGLTNIQKNATSWERKIQQMTLGIRYALWNKKTAR